MKVIFLDFDGVINNWDNFDIVNPKNLEPLLEIINSTGAMIVATTSNKYSFQKYGVSFEKSGFYKYMTILKENGIEIFDITPYVSGIRELEIIEYLKMHPEVEQFLILDDDYIIKSLLEHQVFLELYNGITDEHVLPSIKILNGILGFYPPNFDFNETCEQRIERINKYHAKKRINN